MLCFPDVRQFCVHLRMQGDGGGNSKPTTSFDYKNFYAPKLGWCTEQVTIERRTKVSFLACVFMNLVFVLLRYAKGEDRDTC